MKHAFLLVLGMLISMGVLAEEKQGDEAAKMPVQAAEQIAPGDQSQSLSDLVNHVDYCDTTN